MSDKRRFLDGSDLAGSLGMVLIVAGVGMLSVPAAVITAGVLLFVTAVCLVVRQR